MCLLCGHVYAYHQVVVTLFICFICFRKTTREEVGFSEYFIKQSDFSDILARGTDLSLYLLQRFIQLQTYCLRLASSIRCPACNTTISMCVAETKCVLAASLGFCAAAKASQKISATRGRHTKGRIAALGDGEQRACARVRQVFST